jgi:hypothetical protein
MAGAIMAAAICVGDPGTELHACDWSCYEEGLSRRSFRSPSHFLHHLRGLLSVQTPIAEVYLMRAISPAFRERIMLVTAYANECSW